MSGSFDRFSGRPRPIPPGPSSPTAQGQPQGQQPAAHGQPQQPGPAPLGSGPLGAPPMMNQQGLPRPQAPRGYDPYDGPPTGAPTGAPTGPPSGPMTGGSMAGSNPGPIPGPMAHTGPGALAAGRAGQGFGMAPAGSAAAAGGPNAAFPGGYPRSFAQADAAPPEPQPPAAAPTLDEGARDMYAPARNQDAGRKMKVTAPVVPPGSVTGRSLTLVIAIMCFLACLTAGAVWMIKQSSDAWLRDIASEVTVQVEIKDTANADKAVGDVVTYLKKQKGIASAKPLSLTASAELLEPWLGTSDALKALPVPRLVAIELDRASPPDLAEVSKALSRDFPGATLDDHRRWQQQIRAVTRSFALGGLAILALVAAATMAIIVSATKSAMASNREIVEVLHFVGATDKFISREFEKHFLRLGIKAGIVGAVLAMLVFLGMPAIMMLLGGGTVSAVEMQRLIGTGALDAAGYVLLGLVVVIIAALCMITSRMGVKRILNGQH